MTNTEFYPLWQSKTRETETAIVPLSDHALARAAGEGDMTAFEELYHVTIVASIPSACA